MVYYRLIFQSQNRIMGSSYGNPKFKIAIPFHEYGAGNCKVVFEAFDGYFAKSSKAYNSVILSINATFNNEIQTSPNGGYSGSGGICCINVQDKIGTDYFYHHIDNKINPEKKGLELPLSFFNNGSCEFILTNLNGDVMTIPTDSDLQFYAFSLGVYFENKKIKN